MKKTKKPIENREEKIEEEIRTSNRVGALLKKRREEKKLSLKKVAKHLCIREAFLSAIEEGTKKDLPERVYTLGFVRSYAHYLDLDENAVLNEYTREYKETDLCPHYVFPEPLPQKGVPSFLNYGIGFLILILGLALWIFLKNPFVSNNESIDQEETPKEHSIPEEQSLNQSNESSQTVSPLSAPLITDVAPPQASSPDDASPVTPEEESPSEDDTSTFSPETSTPTSIHLHAKEKVWIQLNDHTETPILTKTMLPGESYTLPYSEDLLLTVGNAGGLQVFIDDNEIPSLGSSGQVKRNISLIERKTS